MAKPTLLEIVQNLLSVTDGDEVNSISDTLEAQQYAELVRDIYDNIAGEYDLADVEVLFQLESAGSTSIPTHMTVPSDVFDVSLVRYDRRSSPSENPAFTPVTYVTREKFLELTSNNDVSDTTNYQSVTDPDSNIVFVIRKTDGPSYYTSFDGGRTLIFDGYNNSVSSTLEASKTQCLGLKRNTLTVSDTSEIDLPENLHQLLKNEAKEYIFDVWKDGAPTKIRREASKSRTRAYGRKHLNTNPDPQWGLPNYGRRRR